MRLQRAVQMYDARGGGGGLGEDALLHALEGFELPSPWPYPQL